MGPGLLLKIGCPRHSPVGGSCKPVSTRAKPRCSGFFSFNCAPQGAVLSAAQFQVTLKTPLWLELQFLRSFVVENQRDRVSWGLSEPLFGGGLEEPEIAGLGCRKTPRKGRSGPRPSRGLGAPLGGRRGSPQAEGVTSAVRPPLPPADPAVRRAPPRPRSAPPFTPGKTVPSSHLGSFVRLGTFGNRKYPETRTRGRVPN